jgi:hypothetical protein
MEKLIVEKYLHINNGGVTIAVIDCGRGPTIRIASSHFGNNEHEQKIHTNAETLRALGEMFIEASESKGYSAVYHCAVNIKDNVAAPASCSAVPEGTLLP